MNPPVIIVGIDGSAASRAALVWAAEAAHRDRELVVVHVFDWRVAGARAPIGGEYAVDARARAEELVESAVADAKATAPTVNVRGEALLGAPGPTLIHAAGQAELLVIGSRGRGGFASLLLGSVSQQVATHAEGPVVVVRGRRNITEGPIVVGADGSEGASLALQVAFEEAVARQAGVLAVRVFTPAAPAMGLRHRAVRGEPRPASRCRGRPARRAGRTLAGEVPRRRGQPVVVDGHPAEALIGLSSSAQLVVVGTRGHGSLAGVLLGSVGLQLLHHADSPVLVARLRT